MYYVTGAERSSATAAQHEARVGWNSRAVVTNLLRKRVTGGDRSIYRYLEWKRDVA
jgi:hypothetical protein